jgi:ribosomal protein S21
MTWLYRYVIFRYFRCTGTENEMITTTILALLQTFPRYRCSPSTSFLILDNLGKSRYYSSTNQHALTNMSFLFRSIAQSSASSSRRTITSSGSTVLRYASTSSPASSVQESIVQPDTHDSTQRSHRSTPIPESLVSASDLSRLQPATDPDSWWSARAIGSSPNSNRLPGNQYTGRSIQIKGGRGFQQAYRQLMGVLSRTGVRNDVRNSEYYEKPHVMRNRQKSERHRRRFQEMVSLRQLSS